ncbi:MAG: hypothetical protein KF895_16615 [Parvibaculum sp.]|uniref:hypothetical protein n=1 Tax=Chelatococcus sp. TaxID=1953771 RepID=UPI001EC76C93|nr:hypothetical protein [Chelatococcus sp.]MBX3507103.1 hypothetical protein [Parvibaculum sp.]MBX3545564.1 hypothetical protein [Chelatococcus sp.]
MIRAALIAVLEWTLVCFAVACVLGAWLLGQAGPMVPAASFITVAIIVRRLS